VTGHAVRPERQDMFRGKGLIHLQMAVGAGGLVERHCIIFYVAILANESAAIRSGLMRVEFEGCYVVIESRGCPILGGVAVTALIAKRSGVGIILFMAGDTFHGRADKEGVNMTSLTSHRGMFAVQLEFEFGMIDRPVPAFRHVT
jgi:hypothetical protein